MQDETGKHEPTTEVNSGTPRNPTRTSGTRPNATRGNVPTVPMPKTPPSGSPTLPPPPTRMIRPVQGPPMSGALSPSGVSRRARRRSIVPPWWAFVLMFLGVGACVGALVAVFVALGGRIAPGGERRLVVLTADPALLAQSGQTILITATLPPEFAPQLQPPVTYVMQGPTLPPPAITPTAETLAVGKTITVIDVGDQQLNVRDNPGVLGTSVIFRSEEGTRFLVIDGPQLVDGLSWWRIQDPANTTRTGWAAANYLQVIPNE